MAIQPSDTEKAQSWIQQFDASDQIEASNLLDSIRFVTGDELIAGVRVLVETIQEKIKSPIALYVERELEKDTTTLFQEDSRRAVGNGPTPILQKKGQPEVGSEGILANLVTQLNRGQRKTFLNHPSPDQMRKRQPRRFVLLTDFIGSGKRVDSYLTAAWNTATLKSWRSYRRIEFDVVAFAGTEPGIERVRRHRCKPEIHLVAACPTIASIFRTNRNRGAIEDLCVRYDPVDHDPLESLGYGGTGALMVFEHGCPNNCPRLLHKQARHWQPFFPGRVTQRKRDVFSNRSKEDILLANLRKLDKDKIAAGEVWKEATEDGRKLLLFLVAIRRGPRNKMAVSANTGLTINEVSFLQERAQTWGWLTAGNRLTDEGHAQIAKASVSPPPRSVLVSTNQEVYFPQSLRPANGDSS